MDWKIEKSGARIEIKDVEIFEEEVRARLVVDGTSAQFEVGSQVEPDRGARDHAAPTCGEPLRVLSVGLCR
jgi:hypothetical protein